MIPGSWTQCTIVALLSFVAVGCVLVRPKKRGASRCKSARPHFVRDYSAEYRKKVAWLGDRYLLAKPINRAAPQKRLRAV